MNNDTLDYTKLKTIIYTPTGYYGSEFLWNDAGYAFRFRYQKQYGNMGTRGEWIGKDTTDQWQYLTNNKEHLREKLGLEPGILPEWDYEYITLDNPG
jgi:hypothetical protein